MAVPGGLARIGGAARLGDAGSGYGPSVFAASLIPSLAVGPL